jgi:hypothetical protein
MTSVNDQFSGVASGINNAITRIANVFANAIFGALAVLFFSGALQRTLPPDLPHRDTVLQQAANLGNAKPPAAAGANDKLRIEQGYRAGFIEAYQQIMRCAAGLAFLGAGMALLFIRKRPDPKPTR